MADIKEHWIIAHGDLHDGYTIIGPFETAEGAEAHGDAYLGEDENWEVLAIIDPAVFAEYQKKRGQH